MHLSGMSQRASRTLRHARHGAWAAAIALALITSAADAQQQSSGALAAARELIELKGVMTMFDPLIPGVVESAKGTFLRTNTALSKDLNEVSTQLKTEFGAKRSEVLDEFSKAYAEHFTEQELRAILAFYKTTAGKKMSMEEPRILDQGMSRVQAWADKLSESVMSRFRAEMKKRGHSL